ncbi:MAG: radical SAM family RiPP maturation amino acid epimerase [Ilumatobacteraceae bacterium]
MIAPVEVRAAGDALPRSVHGQMKRFGEWYLASADFRAASEADPVGTARQYGLDLTEAEARALLRRDLLTEFADLTDVPNTVLEFRDRRRETFLNAHRWRSVGTGADPRFHAWRQRQIARGEIEFGLVVNSQIVHAPVAVELQTGCSVGCWFCGVSAPALDGILPYTPEVARLWAGVTSVLHDVCGDALAAGFLYWATDPLDNPDYERFVEAWHDEVGRIPQTTTAQPLRHLERSRALVARSTGINAGSMRISVLSLPVLRRLFDAFTPEELADIELVMQMPEAATHLALAGRAGDEPAEGPKRGSDRIEEGEAAADTIACASGFLVNMVERTVRMVTPCHSSDRWPDGYRVVGEGSFSDADEFGQLLDRLVDENAPPPLAGNNRLRWRPPLRCTPAFEGFDLHTVSHRLRLRSRPGLEVIGELVSAGADPTVDEVLAQCAARGIPEQQARATLDLLDHQAVFEDQWALDARRTIPVLAR